MKHGSHVRHLNNDGQLKSHFAYLQLLPTNQEALGLFYFLGSTLRGSEVS